MGSGNKVLWVLLFGIAFIAGCGDEPAEAGERTVQEVTDEIEETPDMVLYPEGTLDPRLVTPDTPVYAWDLNEAYFAWDSVTVVVSGYPFIFHGDSIRIDGDVILTDEPDSRERIVTVTFAEPVGVSVARGDIVAARGRVALSWTGSVTVADAEMVDPPASLEPIETSPYAYDGETPIPAHQLMEMCYIWKGMEVTVEGRYHSTTTSTTSHGVTVRIDLSSPEMTGTRFAGCEMAEAVPDHIAENLADNREGLQIRGVVAGESFGRVSLEECVIVNR